MSAPEFGTASALVLASGYPYRSPVRYLIAVPSPERVPRSLVKAAPAGRANTQSTLAFETGNSR